jgi:elongation factor Ts
MSTPITPQMVKQLRDRTDMPMGECKKALEVSGGDIEKAIAYLQEQNSKMRAKREGNETAEGRIGVFIDNAAKVGAIIEVRCESAPSSKSDQFIALTNDLAKQVALKNPKDVAEMLTQPSVGGGGTVQDRVNAVIGLIRENMKPQRFKRLEGGVYGSYVHHDGTVGVLLECKGTTANDELLRDVSAHIAALNPPYTTSADVPADVMAREKELVMADITADPKNAGKPANILEKISEGKLRTRLADIVLAEQPMANVGKYPNTTVGAALKKAGLEPVKFVRFKVGAVTL